MKGLTIEHIAPYLPYGLKVKTPEAYNYYYNGMRTDRVIMDVVGLNLHGVQFQNVSGFYPFKDFMPILYPISEIDNEIQVKGKSFTPFHYLTGTECWCDAYDEWWDLQYPDYDNMMRSCPLEIAEKLFEWHLDVFGLIDNGLAIDVNELDENPYQ